MSNGSPPAKPPGPPGPPPGPPPPIEPSTAAWPYRSYSGRFSSLASTSYASDASWNIFVASGLSLFVSGWYFFASCRYARLIAFLSAPRATPSTS